MRTVTDVYGARPQWLADALGALLALNLSVGAVGLEAEKRSVACGFSETVLWDRKHSRNLRIEAKFSIPQTKYGGDCVRT